MLYTAVLLLAILFIAYRRYYPVKGIQACVNLKERIGRTVVDIRHYHEVHDSIVSYSVCLP